MTLHRLENPDLGLPSDPPAGALGPSELSLRRPGTVVALHRAQYRRTMSLFRLNAILTPALRSLPPPEDFRTMIRRIQGECKAPHPAMARQGSHSDGRRQIEQDIPARCAACDGASLLSRPAINASHCRQMRHPHESPRGSRLGGFLHVRSALAHSCRRQASRKLATMSEAQPRKAAPTEGESHIRPTERAHAAFVLSPILKAAPPPGWPAGGLPRC
jgi:hypothetical protein